MGDLGLKLPMWRPAKITAEVVVKGAGSPSYYVMAGRCIDQSIGRTPEDCMAVVRERWKIEPMKVGW